MNLTDEQLEIVNHDYKKNRKLIIEAVAGCVDEQTEFFDGTKWKKISEYEVGDKVLQYDIEQNIASMTYPIEYHKYPCSTLTHFKNRKIDQCLSDEHRVLYYDHNIVTGKQIGRAHV